MWAKEDIQICVSGAVFFSWLWFKTAKHEEVSGVL